MFMERPAGCSWNGWPDAVECAVDGVETLEVYTDAAQRGAHMREPFRAVRQINHVTLHAVNSPGLPSNQQVLIAFSRRREHGRSGPPRRFRWTLRRL